MPSEQFTINNVKYSLDWSGTTLDGIPRLSLPYQRSKRIAGQPTRSLAKALELEIYGQSSQSKKLTWHLETILYNLYICSLITSQLPDYQIIIKYSRARSNYHSMSRYGDLSSYPIMMKLIQSLIDAGYIGHVMGYKLADSAKGKRSFFWPTPKMLAFLNVERIVKHHIIQTNTSKIILKNEDKEIIEFKDTRKTLQWTKIIEGYVGQIEKHSITKSNKDVKYLTDDIRMVFNEKFTLGGRIYMSLQNMSKEWRQEIKIDGEETACLDFQSLHCNILYDLYNVSSYRPDDPYDIPLSGYSGTADDKRKLFKTVMLILINAKSRNAAKASLYLKVLKKKINLGGKEIEEIITQAEKYHLPISKKFYLNMGLTLQNIDKDMAIYILKAATKEDKPILPIHDGFICRNSDRQWLFNIMKSAYETRLPGSIARMKWEYNAL